MKHFIILFFCAGVSLTSLAQNVVQVEYFIDTDLGFGKNTLVNLTPSADGTFPLSVPVSGFQPGFHKLYIRTKNSDGKWSLTARRNIEVLASNGKTTVISGEYFIDTDPGFGKASTFSISSPDSIVLQNFSAVASTLSEGYHKLYGRVKDNLGRWSLTFRRNMEVYKSINTNVTKVEYFFKTDLGFDNCASAVFINPAADGNFNFTIPLSAIPKGADSLFVRVQNDGEYRWSQTKIFTTPSGGPLPLTLLNFTATKQNESAIMNWQTSNEINTAYFNIQRSNDAINFQTVGKVNANNISNIVNTYSYVDNIQGLAGPVIYYRLQMVDKDENSQYSKVASLPIDGGKQGLTIFPNPAVDYINISTTESDDLNGSVIKIVDMTGRIIRQERLMAESNQQVNVSSLSKGIYMLYINKHSGIEIQKLIKE